MSKGKENQPKIKSILIVGSDHPDLEKLQKFYKEHEDEGFVILGDGKQSLVDIGLRNQLTLLKDRIDINTRINIWAHGIIEDNTHVLENVSTSAVLNLLNDIAGKKPLNVHLYSCFAGAASNEVENLPIGSTLVCHAEENPTLVEFNKKNILESSKRLLNSPSTLNPILDFTNNILSDTKHTATISQRMSEQDIFKFSVRPWRVDEKHPQVLNDKASVKKYYESIREELVRKYNGMGKEYKMNQIDFNSLNPLLDTGMEEWRRDHFHYLISNGDENLKKVLEKNENNKFDDLINSRTPKGFTPLMTSVMNCNEGLARILIKKGADINIVDKNNQTLLHLASLSRKHDEGQASNNVNLINLLVKNGIEVDAQNKDKQTALHLAAIRGNVESIKILLENGANIEAIDNKGLNPLHWAVLNNKSEAVKTLVDGGANVNIEMQKGVTLLSYAAMKCNEGMLQTLLNKNNDINKIDARGYSLLHYAVLANNQEAVKTLIKNNIDINLVDKSGKTALKLASYKGYNEIVESLSAEIEKGQNSEKVTSSKATRYQDQVKKSRNQQAIQQKL